MSLQILERKFHPQNELNENIQDRNSLFKILKFLRSILQFLGIMPVIKKSQILSLFQISWCALVLFVIWLKCFQMLQNVRDTFTLIEKGFYLSELIFCSAIPLDIFYITFFKKSKFLKIYQNYIKLFEQLRMCRGLGFQSRTLVYRQLRKEVLLLTLLIVTIYIFCISIIIFRTSGFNNSTVDILLAFIIPNILISSNLCLYWLSLRFISLSYSHLNTILKGFQDHRESGSCSIYSRSYSLWYQKEFGDFNSKKSFKFPDIFITLTEISRNLDELMHKVVKIFYIVLIMEFCNSFAIFTVQIFSTYKYFDNPDVRVIWNFLIKFARLLLHTFDIILILWSNNTITNEKCRTIFVLNSLSAENLDMEHNICDFLLQLRVRKHSASVFDMFDLDISFLLSIISALSTYVIFLIQIDLGAVSIEERKTTVY
ncbi:uncharacterized protein ACRADG_010525 [Cochliomyia hominivorax]